LNFLGGSSLLRSLGVIAVGIGLAQRIQLFQPNKSAKFVLPFNAQEYLVFSVEAANNSLQADVPDGPRPELKRYTYSLDRQKFVRNSSEILPQMLEG
jgi:hypothetical protein